MATAELNYRLIPGFPERARSFPQIRFMGSKYRLLPWVYEVLATIQFETALDAFSGSGCVSYLMKCMGKQVFSNDLMNFSSTIARALIENPGKRLEDEEIELLLSYDPKHKHFIANTFTGIFFSVEDLRFLDQVWYNIPKLENSHKEAIAISSLVRSCAKRQPRGVFTVAGDPERYKDGRRDLQLSLREHFVEHTDAYNRASFDNHLMNRSTKGDIFTLEAPKIDLVYMDPPYVPRSDDNCYIKRYHFLEGVSSYWQGVEILAHSKVKKLKKPFTPFSYRRTALDAFNRLFAKFSESILILSYSSNGFPDLKLLVDIMRCYKRDICVYEKDHRYHFGTHVSAERNNVQEYLIVGT